MNRLIKRVSIVLPTYNEAENIIPLIRDIVAVVPYDKEIIVVDDASPDKTAWRVKGYIRRHPQVCVRIIERTYNHGLTNSIKEGIAHASGDVVVWMDCDFSHPPEIIPQLLKKIEDGYDVAVASRFVKGGKGKPIGSEKSETLSTVVFSTFLNNAIRCIFKHPFKDYTSGFTAVVKSVFDTVFLRGDYGEYFIDFILSAYQQGYKVTEIPFVSPPRRFGETKTASSFLQLIKRGWKYIAVVFFAWWEWLTGADCYRVQNVVQPIVIPKDKKREIVIRPMQKDDIQAVITVHQSRIRSAGSSMGKVYLRPLYEYYLSHENVFFCRIAEYEKNVLGMIVASKYVRKSSLPLLKEFFLLPQILWYLFSHPRDVMAFVARVRIRNFLEQYKSTKKYLIVSMAVDRSVTRSGIGKLLIQDLIKTAKKEKMNFLFVDTLADNFGGIQFYHACGFAIVAHVADAVVMKRNI